MRTEELNTHWSLAGRIDGAALPDVVSECALPFALEDMAQHCAREGLFLRRWELTHLVERPQETAHSHAERTFLTLDGVYGMGELLLNGTTVCALQPHMEVEITDYVRKDAIPVTLRFSPHFPHLYAGERGRELPVETALLTARVRNIYLLRICELRAQDRQATLRIHAYGSGKVRVCLRLMRGEDLLWSENFDQIVHVGEQEWQREMQFQGNAQGATLRASIDMGGEGCDAATTPYLAPEQKSCTFAHFRKLPTEEMLCKIKQAGFDAVVLHTYAHEELRTQCAALGLCLKEELRDFPLRQLYAKNAEYEEKRGVLCVPVTREDDSHAFLQAQKLCEATACLRSKGEEIHILALCRQNDAQDGLFDADGDARPALYALKNVLGKYALWAEGEKRLLAPCDRFSQPIVLLCRTPQTAGAMIVEASLYRMDGKEIAQRSFPVCCKQERTAVGTLTAQLPWDLGCGLILRLRLWKAEKLLAQHHALYPCADEDGTRVPFGEADLTESDEGGQRVLYNASDCAAVGVNVLSGGKPLLCGGVLLPQERLVLREDQELDLWYANPIRKGGKDIVAKRILRGVFGAGNGAAAHPQAGHR